MATTEKNKSVKFGNMSISASMVRSRIEIIHCRYECGDDFFGVMHDGKTIATAYNPDVARNIVNSLLIESLRNDRR